MISNVLEEFIALAKINSPSKKEGELSNYLKKRLNELGADIFEDSSAEKTGSDTGNLIAVVPGNTEKPTILLSAHMDTVVGTEGMVPQIRDGVVYSDGQTILGADDKAGIAVILSTLSALQEDSSIGHGPVEVLLTVQEEQGLFGVKNLDYPLKSQYGYVLDGDGPVGTIINASPSHNTLDIVVEGRAAHAGLAPETGINAIVVAAEAIASLPSGRLDEETTSNFGMISGGKGRNVVADRVEIIAEVRSRSKEKLNRETAKMIKCFEETATRHNAKLQVNKQLAYEAFTITPQQPVIISAAKAGEKMGIEVNLKATGGGLDANILNARGITCVALGFGSGDPHTNTEYQSIEEMEKAVRFIVEILQAAV